VELVGSTIGAHEVISELGRGGMGVVYLGRDTRLGRSVAIKALPKEFAGDADRLARFRREARTLALLNHPAVAQVFGLEEAEGAQFLVMEFVEGESLAAALARGPLEIDEALRIGSQVASGVEAAHDQGVIHRDLKPGNVIVTPDGRSKVLDFGLAREMEARGSSLDLSHSPTATLPTGRAGRTQAGQVMGTVAYMSPEQARGRVLDKRTDIWSFGCVLFEMLTGASPFARETASDSIAALLEREPDWSALPARTPARVRDLLEKCLEKDQNKRLRDIGDARLELEKASADREWTTGSMSAAADGSGRVERRLSVGAALALGAIIGGLALATGWLIGGRSGSGLATGAPGGDLAPTRFMKVTDGPGVEAFPSLTPDGRNVVYASSVGGNSDIYRLRIGGLNPVNLTAGVAENDTMPAVSPDGERIVFRSERMGGGLFVMGATGESPRRVSEDGFNPSWSPDGKNVVFATEAIGSWGSRLMHSLLFVVDVDTGARRQLGEMDAVQPSWSPNGERIAYWTTVGGGQRDLFTIPAAGGEPVAVTNDAPTDWNPVWSADGRWLYFSSDRSGVMGIWRIAVDQSSGAVLGAPQPVTAGATGALGHLSVSREGNRLAYAAVESQQTAWRVAFDPEKLEIVGAPEPVSRGSIDVSQASVSPDGAWLVYTGTGGGREDIFLLRTDGSERRQLTDDAAKDRGPRWSSDGKRIAFYSDRGGQQYGVWVMNSDGSGAVRLTPPEKRWLIPVWTPDGSGVLAGSGEAVSLWDSRKGWAEQSAVPVVPADSDVGALYPVDLSPDGRWLMCTSDRDNLCVFDRQTSTMRKAPDGVDARAAQFVPGKNRRLVIRDESITLYDAETNEMVAERPNPLGEVDSRFSFTADGRWLYFVRQEVEGDVWVVEFERSEAE